jgi:hypothetical protein
VFYVRLNGDATGAAFDRLDRPFWAQDALGREWLCYVSPAKTVADEDLAGPLEASKQIQERAGRLGGPGVNRPATARQTGRLPLILTPAIFPGICL